MSHQEAIRAGDNLWLLSPEELSRLSDDTQLESDLGYKKSLAELRGPYGSLDLETNLSGHTHWGLRADNQPNPQRQLEQ